MRVLHEADGRVGAAELANGYDGIAVRDAQSRLATALAGAGKADARLDARLLVAHAVGIEPPRLTFEAARILSRDEAARLALMETARLGGLSVGRIVGRRAFHDIVLEVRDRVLEPRDDTGALIDLALHFLRDVCDAEGGATLWDVGCGSGAVALALLHAEPRARGLATDVSPDCVKATKANAERVGIAPSRLEVRHADGLNVEDGRHFDLIVSNPPYIPSAEIAGLEAEVLADPRNALDGGPDGMRFYELLARGAEECLRPGGRLVVEIGAGQGQQVTAIMLDAGWRADGSKDDLAGHQRALAFDRG